MPINPIPGTPDYIWTWQADQSLAPAQNAASIGLAVAGIAATAMGALQNTMSGIQTPVVFVPLLGRLR